MPPESPRIAELLRRVHADPASIAFAQLAEEYRRAGHYDDAVKYCRAGLARHPGYLSARVTLGRALVEVGELDEAAREFELVVTSAPDNLAAIRGLAEIAQRRGNMAAALAHYKRALELARFDSELEETVNRIARELGTVPAPATTPAASGDAPGADALMDFDAILESLGTPEATPPPVMELLLSGGAPPAAPTPSEPPEPLLQASAVDVFADLERELRQLEHPQPAVPEQTDPFLEELEAWVRVLHSERALLTT